MPVMNIHKNLPIYYEDYGNGIPILFIPPPGMGHVVFKYQNLLAKDFRVITYDIRGQGRSGRFDGELSISMLAEDIHLLLERLNLSEAVICGYSAGSSIALQFALQYPKETKALILSGGFPEVSTFLLEKEYKLGMKLVKENPKLLAKILAKSHHITKDDERQLFHHILKNDQWSWYQNYKESLHYKCTDQLHLLQMPVFLIYGQLSFYLKGYRKYFLEQIVNVRVDIIKGAFHQIPMKNFQVFNEKVGVFMRSLKDID